MNMHNLPTDVVMDDDMDIDTDIDMDDCDASMTPHMPQNGEQTPGLPWANTSEVVTTKQQAAQAVDSTEGLGTSLFEVRPGEQAATDIILLSPLDDHIQVLYGNHQTSYAFPISETSAHMQHGKDLALALLQRHYPDSHGFLVEPAILGPYSAKGVNFVLKESNESDSDPDTPPLKKQKRALRKTHAHYSYSAPWHHIAPEYMTAFVVKKVVSEAGKEVEPMTYRTHTYLVIVFDDLSTFQRWSRDNVNHRGDVLSDLLGVVGEIERGHGMLFFGPRLELYNYDAISDDQPVKPAPNQDRRMDMRMTSLAAADEVLRYFIRQEVVYKDMK